MTAYNSINNNVFFFFNSALKIVYFKNYLSSIIIPWTREEKYFALFGEKIIQNCPKINGTY